MALDFPTSPALNEIYTYGGRSWQWNGTAWDVYSAPGGLTQYVSQLNGLCGSINIAAGTSISVTPTGNTLTIAYTGTGGGGGPTMYVESFNGLTGAVTGVSTVNGLTGTVTNVALTTNTLAQFASTTSAQLASIISNETGGGGVLVFNTSPTITTSITTASSSFALVNTNATTLNLGGAATTLTMGGISGTASIRNATLLLGNTNNTITTNTGTTNYIIIQPYGELRLAPNSTAISAGGTIPSLTVSNTVDAAGFVTVAGGDLLLSTKSTDGFNTTPVNLIFEGATDNTNETTLTVVDPTADRTITFPDASGTVALTSSTVSSLSGSTYISVSGSTGAVTITNTGVQSFNGLTGAVIGVTVGGTNVFTALNSFNAGISAAGGTFSSQTRFLAGITVAGGATFGTDISVFGIRVGRGNQGATSGGDTNLAVGANALNSVVPNPSAFAGIQNLAFGTSALQNTTSGGYNSAFGTEALYINTSGGGNIAFGVHALRLNTSGAENCAFGGGPMYQNTTGAYNTAIGSLSYYYKSTGSYNVAVGYQAGYNYGTPSSGNAVTSATNCTLIGTYATPLTSGTSNEIVIGYNAIGKGSNTVVLGNSSITSTDLTGVVNNPSGLSAAGATFSSNVSIGGNLIVTGTIVGNQGINAQTGTTYSLVLSDSGKLVTLNNVSGITMTFPTYASVGITTGAVVYFAQLGAGTVGFTGAAGVSVRTTPGLFLRTQYSTASAIKIATNEWLVSGDMTA